MTDTTSNRAVLMPPHLRRFDAWNDFANALDTTWEQIGIVDAIEQLKWLRSPINTQDVVISNGGKLLAASSIPVQDRTTLVLTADMLGFRFYETELLTADNYLRLCQHLVEYYGTDKGTEKWSEFLGFCLDTQFTVQNTWTSDYETFYPEGDPAIGTSIADGGLWYPTTHIIVSYELDRFQGIEPSNLVEFFYYFANLNLVIWLTEMVATASFSLNVAASATIEVLYPAVPQANIELETA